MEKEGLSCLQDNEAFQAIRVYLFCPDDTYRTVWVPYRMDGRYAC